MVVLVIFNAKISPLNYPTNFYLLYGTVAAGFQTIWVWFISSASQFVMTYELWQTFTRISHQTDGVNSDTRGTDETVFLCAVHLH